MREKQKKKERERARTGGRDCWQIENKLKKDKDEADIEIGGT